MRDSQPPSTSSSQPNTDPFDLLEAYVDGELNEEDSRFLEHHLATNSELADELALTRRVQLGLRALPKQRCPEAVSQRVWSQTLDPEPADVPSRHPNTGRRPSLLDQWASAWRAAFAALEQRPARLVAGFALVAIALVSHHAWVDLFDLSAPGPVVSSHPGPGTPNVVHSISEIEPSNPDGSAPSAQEVARAEQEVKLALAYLGKLGRTAGKSVVQITADSAGRSSARGKNP